MSRFKRIKNTSTKKSSVSINEKIASLNQELEKTGMLNVSEMLTTSNIYPQTSEVPNQNFADFEAASFGGQGLGFSGADGNSAGGADIGDAGVALSPPHPVTGVRVAAAHVRDGTGGTEPLRPGKITFRGFGNNPPPYTMGSAIWFYDADHDNGVGVPQGRWCNLEYGNFVGNSGWGFWDTIKTGQFAGFYKFETDLSLHSCGDIGSLIAGITFGTNGALGGATTIVITQKGLETEPIYPGPIANLFGLGQRAFDWMKGKAEDLADKFKDAVDDAVEDLKDILNDLKDAGEDFAKDFEEFMDERKDDVADIGKAAEVYGDYLSGNLKDGDIDNDYLGQDYVDDAFTDAFINDKGTVTVGDNVIGSGGKPQYDSDTGIVTIPFEYDFDTNEEQIMKDPDKYDATQPDKAAAMFIAWLLGGKYGLDSVPVPFAGYATWASKNLGFGAKPTTGHGITMPIEQVKEINPNFYNYIMQNNIGVSESYISESAKLGYFEPKELNVDIEDLRKGIMPEYPKKPPAEMIDGYHQKSPLRSKPLKDEPLVKITKLDLIRNHRLKPGEVDEMMDTINLLNDYIKKHPEDYIHAQMRYPKDDPRLAELNWKMDQMLDAGKEYLDSNFKVNQSLFKRATERTKKNTALTNPDYIQKHYDELRGTIKSESKPTINRKSPSRFFKKPKKKSSMEAINDKIKQLDKDLLI